LHVSFSTLAYAGVFMSAKFSNVVFLIIGILCLPILVLLAAFYLPIWFLWGEVLRVWFWRAHASHGRFILFVYSESPNWQAYVEENILPRIRERAIVLNWSERRLWASNCPWEWRFFRRFAGDREFNPLALVFCRYGRVRAVRFHQAFLDYKHGKPLALQQAEAQLFELAKDAA
jgi:hypothetical protein